MSVTYGVLRGKVAEGARAEDIQARVRAAGDHNYTSNHYHILVEASGALWRCPVNVRSEDNSEVWFKIRDPFVGEPILADLDQIPEGLLARPDHKPRKALDFLREPLFDRMTMRHLPKGLPGPSDDIQDQLDLYIQAAKADPNAEIWVFGSFWTNQVFPPDKLLGTNRGVHDVHMNQGNSQKFRKDDGLYQDGGVIIRLPGTNRHVGLFMAFNSQVWFTDNAGHSLPGFPPGPLAKGTTPTPTPAPVPPTPVPPAPTPTPAPVPPAGPSAHAVRIIAALVNPEGDDVGKETVVVFNGNLRALDLTGWTVEDRAGHRETLSGTLDAVSSRVFTLSGQSAQLGNNGGAIRLNDAQGNLAHAVTYVRADIVNGQMLLF